VPAAADDEQDDAGDGDRRRAGGRRLRRRYRRVGHNDETVSDGHHQDHFADIADCGRQDRREVGRPPTTAPAVICRALLGK